MLGATAGTPEVNAWLKPADGHWEETYWSLGILPNSTQWVEITNIPIAELTIGPSAVQNVPASLTVARLEVGSYNALVLNHAGTDVPLRVLRGMSVEVGRVCNFFSALAIEAGGLRITNGLFCQDGGWTTVSGGLTLGGDYNLTNGTVQADVLRVGTDYNGTFNQYGGTMLAEAVWVGTEVTPPYIPLGSYSLKGGALIAGNVDVGGGSSFAQFKQDGGTNAAQHLRVLPNSIPGYLLNGGTLATERTEVLAGEFQESVFEQTGGAHVITNELRLEGGIRSGASVQQSRYVLSGGTLATRLLTLANYAQFAQTNGTAAIAESLSIETTNSFQRVTSYLAGGVLSCANLRSGGIGADLRQTGGNLIVTNLLSFNGAGPYNAPSAGYILTGGTLYASNIDIEASLVLGPGGQQKRRVENPGYFKLSGSLIAADIDEQLGRFILGTNATLDMGGGSSKLRFAPSSAEPWAAGALLSVLNWSASSNGTGATQLIFGQDLAGLNLGQLSQIRFVNPAGLPLGTYYAKLLGSGEVVPTSQPLLLPAWQGTNLVLNWPGNFILQSSSNVSGPYAAIPVASSPYEVDIKAYPRRFFRLVDN